VVIPPSAFRLPPSAFRLPPKLGPSSGSDALSRSNPGTLVPARSRRVPRQRGHVPSGSCPVPARFHLVPSGSDTVPFRKGHVPSGFGRVPSRQRDVPSAFPSVPFGRGHVPFQKGHSFCRRFSVPSYWGQSTCSGLSPFDHAYRLSPFPIRQTLTPSPT